VHSVVSLSSAAAGRRKRCRGDGSPVIVCGIENPATGTAPARLAATPAKRLAGRLVLLHSRPLDSLSPNLRSRSLRRCLTWLKTCGMRHANSLSWQHGQESQPRRKSASRKVIKRIASPLLLEATGLPSS